MNREAAGVDPTGRDAIDIRTAKALTRAMEQAGIRPSQKARRVGDYVLRRADRRGPRGLPGPAGQARGAAGRLLPGPAVPGRPGRRRGGPAADEAGGGAASSASSRASTTPASSTPATTRTTSSARPCCSPTSPRAMRLDHYLATRGAKLTPGTRLELLRQVADAVRYAHRKRVIHRALAPQSVLVMDPDADDAPAQGLQLAGRRPRGRGGLRRHGPRRGAGRPPGDRLHGPRGAARPEGGDRGVRRLLAGGDRLPPVRRAAPRRRARPRSPGCWGSTRG